MSAVEVVAVVTASVWLALLSCVLLLALRQIAILTVQLERMTSSGRTAEEGLGLGVQVPPELAATVPEVALPLGYVLLFSSSCTPCHVLAPKLMTVRSQVGVAALVAGEPARAAQIAQSLPPWVRVVRDPEASVAAASLNLDRTPYVMEFQRGEVTAKTFLHSPSDLTQLFDAGARSMRARSLEVQRAN